ncbi:adenylate kinase-like protein 1, putative [Plasmodium vivax]|uniref:Adenylate kinase isoenzyme 6 homolog n=3 Tax=Plasmodium vivax TaxID=5855 RepID=A5K9R1_PLAVS|nr:Hemoglobin and proliferation regulated protein HBR1, putative [Plasmodium vivax]EDL43799.1 Hemoglobin and proliferation regulated protein HBR1, putative [Plasmodium vivax]KMZ89195.1 hemoglobin and proliferation regulated protein HBR1 [Plasmodium vivax Brazil I]KMZ95518.1 hemoglobin and proliferation regulated protein HBR1 [Plasmodium vivax Mauritania I]CAI7717885.1 adenylate kinase-like protein 1, putative [Plasmodium vivax]|eukprot:XP_001613526.1 Hemoglobin and proliferation regulated protein HBR1 [Plasmodium vivax Sal-1]
MRSLPNIIVTGVPGVGKTTLCEELVEVINKELQEGQQAEPANQMKHLNLSKVIKEERLYEEFDDQLDATIYSNDMVNEKMEKLKLENGGYIIDFHDVDFLEQKELIDHIFLLTTSTNKLYERLEKRNYAKEKIKNNIECEIFQVIKEDILTFYNDPSIFDELGNNDMEQYESNLQLIKGWVLSWAKSGEALPR